LENVMPEATATTPYDSRPPLTPPAPAVPGNDAAADKWSPPDPSQFALVRKPGGGSEFVARSSLPSEQPNGAASVPNAAANGSTNGATPPAAVVDGKLVLGELELSEQDIRAIWEAKGASDSRRATLPATPGDYVLELPADFKLPDGVKFAWVTDHPVTGPLIAAAREFAHAHGIDQAGFSKMMSLYAASVVHENAQIKTALDVEIAKLGATGSGRVDAISTWLRGVCGDTCARAIMQQAFRADFVVGLEKIASKMMNGNIGSSFSQVGREPTDARGNRVSEEAWATMSHGERLDYSRGFDQRQFNPDAPRRIG
jgi:hypothetical protein